MITLQSTSVEIKQPIGEVFEYIQNIDNLKIVFNRISKDWQNTSNTLKFRLGVPFLSKFSFEFKVDQVEPYKIYLKSYGESYANCSIIIKLVPDREQTLGQFLFETPEETFQDTNCPTKPLIIHMLQIFCNNLASEFN